jgi:hypothetical protein
MTTYLAMGNWFALYSRKLDLAAYFDCRQLPTTQSFFVYFVLCCVYTPWTIYQYGFKAWAKMLYTDGWRYLVLAAIDVEANFLVVKAYRTLVYECPRRY